MAESIRSLGGHRVPPVQRVEPVQRIAGERAPVPEQRLMGEQTKPLVEPGARGQISPEAQLINGYPIGSAFEIEGTQGIVVAYGWLELPPLRYDPHARIHSEAEPVLVVRIGQEGVEYFVNSKLQLVGKRKTQE